MRVATGPVETEGGAPVVDDEDDGLGPRDDGGDEFVEVESVFDEAVGQVRKLVRCAHADQVGGDAAALVGDVGDDVTPEVR